MKSTYALILAGGSGTRFWPLSRNSKPKQLLNLLGDTTLLNQTIDRLEGLIPKENILILTNQLQEAEVRSIASDLPAENIFAEPAKRDTAPAVALGIGLIAARDPKATMVILPSDQLIEDTANFQQTLTDAVLAAAHSPSLVTIGIQPTWPCPSYGYIERGSNITIEGIALSHPITKVARFREKPNKERAQQFLDQGNFAWNAGMFIWSVPTVIAELQQHAPQLAEFIAGVQTADDITSFVAKHFPQLTATSIDYALMENAAQVLNISATFDWDDVGSWLSVAKYLHHDTEGNQSNSPLTAVDAAQNIIFTQSADTQVALLGVDDLIIVQTGDSILVANKHQADNIKKIVSQLPERLK